MAAGVKKNYQRAMEEEIERIEREQTQGGSVPTLLLHSCCGPCSTSVLEQLAEHFLVTVLYYNPNIFPEGDCTGRRGGERGEALYRRAFPPAIRSLS